MAVGQARILHDREVVSLMMPTFVHWPGFLGFVFTILTLAVLVATVPIAVAFAKRDGAGAAGQKARTSAEDALRLRYARGEIDATELNERLAALRAAERQP
jgi:uncharacterized membrane protein